MTFARPDLLWLGLLLALPVAAYARVLRERSARARRWPALARTAPGWQRHLSPALLFVAVATLLVASAGPHARLALPSEQRTLMLVIDASGSMQATDIGPNRITACQAAAKALVDELPRNVRVGVVAYADSATLVQPPTLERDAVRAAIDGITVDGGTAIGDGVVVALSAIFPGQGIAVPEPDAPPAPPPAAGIAAPGSYRSAAIVLLTDGQNSAGSDPLDAARMAAMRGVKVYTVGFGTKDGVVLGPETGSVRVKLDEETLERIAGATGAQYFHAASGHELGRVYQGLESRLAVDDRDTELTALFALAAAVLVALGAGASLWWYGRVA